MLEDPFVEVKKEDLETVLKVLESRLPRSSHLYNTAIMMRTVDLDLKVYTFDGDLSSDCWILHIFNRVDYGRGIDISAPTSPIVTDAIRSAFITSNVFDWHHKYFFSALDSTLAIMILEISAMVNRNATAFNPYYFFYMNKDDALRLKIDLEDGLELKSLVEEGGAEFLVENWKYSGERTLENTRMTVQKCESSGIFKNQEPVSGVLMNINGLIGMLHTARSHRGKGLAQICMKSLMKKVAEDGLFPASCCEQKNFISKAFHEKIGMKISHECVYVYYSGTSW